MFRKVEIVVDEKSITALFDVELGKLRLKASDLFAIDLKSDNKKELKLYYECERPQS